MSLRRETLGAVKNVPLLDMGRANGPLREELLEAIGAVIDSGRFLFGPDVAALESDIALLSGARHGIACASGSDALLLALMALDVGSGDEVIVPSFTFFATASAAWRLGARPVFVDIEPTSFNLDPNQLQAAITPATKAIIPVHLFGQCASITAINEIAAQHGLTVIEDAAQSIGASIGAGRAGSMGAIGTFSFYPTKNLGAFGDGGMLTTNDDQLAERIRLFAAHGMNPRYYHRVVGINSRLDSIQAAVLRVKLKQLPAGTRQRQLNAARYSDLLRSAGSIVLPANTTGGVHIWNQYTIRVRHGLRDTLREHLRQRGIGTEIYYPVPLHQQECFRSLADRCPSLPETERAAREVLSLPIYPELTGEEQKYVADTILNFAADQRAAA